MEIVPGFQYVPAEIAVGEHNALGVAGGSGSIEYGRNVHRVRILYIAVAGIGFAVHLYETEIVQTDGQFEFCHPFRTDFRFLLGTDEHYFGLGMFQDVLHFGRGELGKHRDKNAPESSSCKECNGPVRHTLREYCHLVSCIDPEAGEFAGEAVRPFFYLGIGICLSAFYKPGGVAFGEFFGCVIIHFRKG